ncbi:MAG: DNA repair protein RecO [Alphaproteobacteria bacterium TMED89]|nr:DNA repair protein RecO [Rhodospirillaceae bacterium]RPH15715.1 MAG: DNA repair protein RecO [Alphaproteobacteria bacterium TMED89]
MVEWRMPGIVLSARRYGEGDLVVNVLTEEMGRHAGLVHGGGAKRNRASFEVGNRLDCSWAARLNEHLGTYRAEMIDSAAAGIMHDPDRLAALASLCALIDTALPEREPAPGLYAAMNVWLDQLQSEHWAALLVRIELGLLEILGFGLDLSSCAVTGETDALTHVSPKSGRAVSATAAEPYLERLLPLPGFLIGSGAADEAAIVAGLQLSGHFLERRVFNVHNWTLPPQRALLVQRMQRRMREG